MSTETTTDYAAEAIQAVRTNEKTGFRFGRFLTYLIQADGPGALDNAPYTFRQFGMLEAGIRDGRISDAALVAYSRLS